MFLLPAHGLIGVVALVVAAGGFEWARLCRLSRRLSYLYGGLAALLFALPAWLGEARPFIALGAAFWALAAPLWMRRGVAPAHGRLLAAAGLVVLVPAGLALIALTPLQALLTLGLTWVADTAAYFSGRRFGRHKLAPVISPSKTWEGVGGALLATLAYAIICAKVAPILQGISGSSWGGYLAAALLLLAASILGDLFESAAKRQASVKDSGALLPGHGGLLDRIDSATGTLPFAALLWPLIGPQ